ncbi:hypothetical protein niasHS_012596 [Heterodera schachtii]|uniref:RNA methyltransferase n=1 Tax=Heterodera schachtii TaxID=97005 RepID=A0ABD2I9F4_HETSC
MMSTSTDIELQHHRHVAVPASELTPSPSTTTATATDDGSTTTNAAADMEQHENAGRKRNTKDRFRYGNYNRYYGVRNQGFDHDPRVDLFPVQWFHGRRVLDIGCNVGHLTLEIAKKLGPAHIVGIDIDDHLVGVARKNIRHYCGSAQKLIGKFPASLLPPAEEAEASSTNAVNDDGESATKMELENGKEEGPSSTTTATKPAVLPYGQFPKNVWFLRENYVLDCDEFLEMVREEYDVILALSITKWVHLNWGDDGLKRFLRRTFLNLRPGGRLLLEAQPFPSYYKKAKMTSDMFETYKAIQFKPYQFKDFLLSDKVGFSECEELGTPTAISKGFERPILVFKKASSSSTTTKRKREKSLSVKRAAPSSSSADDQTREL